MKLVQSNCTGTCCTCTGPVSAIRENVLLYYSFYRCLENKEFNYLYFMNILIVFTFIL